MLFTFFTILLSATAALASPARVERLPRSYGADLMGRDFNNDKTHPSHRITKRATDVDFSLEHDIVNQTLYHGKISDTLGGVTGTIDLDVECVECKTAGTITATLTDHGIIKPHLRLDFHGVSAYANMHVTANGIISIPINLFTSESPVGIGFPGFDIGLLFFVDLVLSLSDSIEFSGGFSVTLPEDATVEMDIFGGDIVNSKFDGTTTQSIPIEVHVGNAKLTADLRIRVQAGAEAKSIFGIGGGGAIIALYANIAEFVAELAPVQSDTCALEAHEWFDINVGALASAGATAGWITMSEAPAVSTTVFTSPTETQCLDAVAPALITPAPGVVGDTPVAPAVPSRM